MRGFALLLLFVSIPALADVLRLPIPGETWDVKIDTPVLTKIKETTSPNGYAYLGNADRLNLSLHVENPSCPGDDSSQNLYKCFGEKLQRVPRIIPASISAQEFANGVQVSYLMEVPANDRTLRVFNVHILFARQGKWGDLHVSIVQPSRSDLEKVAEIVMSLKTVERDKQ